MKALSFVVPFLALAACSSDGKKKPVMLPDAPTTQQDAPVEACTAPASLSMASNFAMGYVQDRSPDAGDDGIAGNEDDGLPGNQEYWIAIGDLDAEAKRDFLWVELWEGPPPAFTVEDFPATPFTMNIQGAEIDYFTCSMCISLTTDNEEIPDMDGDGQPESQYADDYMASAGTVTITELSATKITGTLNNVTFAHVDMDFNNGTQTPNPSNCSSSAPSISFSAMPAMMANGKTAWRAVTDAKISKRGRLLRR